jgi:hypothetical protein
MSSEAIITVTLMGMTIIAIATLMTIMTKSM